MGFGRGARLRGVSERARPAAARGGVVEEEGARKEAWGRRRTNGNVSFGICGPFAGEVLVGFARAGADGEVRGRRGPPVSVHGSGTRWGVACEAARWLRFRERVRLRLERRRHESPRRRMSPRRRV